MELEIQGSDRLHLMNGEKLEQRCQSKAVKMSPKAQTCQIGFLEGTRQEESGFESRPTAATTTTERKIMRVGAEAESSEAL